MTAHDFYRALWRHRFFIVGMTVIVGVIGYFVASSQTKQYEATALVRIQQQITSANDAFGSLEVGSRLAQTYATIVTTRSIQDRVRRELGSSPLPDEIRLSSRPVNDVELLDISATSADPIFAARVANTAANTLQQFIKDTGTLRDQIVLVDPATVPDTPVAPRVKLTVAVLVLLALMFNSALALLLDLVADRLPPTDEFEQVFGRPVIATVPNLTFRDKVSTREGQKPRPGGPRQAETRAPSAPTLVSGTARESRPGVRGA